MTRPIRYIIGVVLCIFFVLPSVNAQQINHAEYFFDNDPGPGNGTSIAISSANTIDKTINIPTTGLTPGLHYLYIRTQATNGKWSLTSQRTLFINTANTAAQKNIVAAEYYINNDPGFGAGTPVSLSASASIDITKSVVTASLNKGLHFIYFRVKDTEGKWSLAAQRLFYLTNSQTTEQIARAEYFYDNDPGMGQGTAITVSTGNSIDLTQALTTSNLSPGIHFLSARVQNVNGQWSLAAKRIIYISNNSSVSQISAAEYYFDNDPGIGNGSALSITAADTINVNSSIATNSLTPGLHYLYVRVKDASGSWSLSANQLLYTSEPVTDKKIVKAEYFYDTDPGFGQGNSISITPADTINITTVLNTDGISQGIHHVNIRVKDASGKWSLNSRRMVYFKAGAVNSPNITAMEYFFDQDPGFGSGNTVNVTSSSYIDLTQAISSANLSIGSHQLYIRAKDSLSRWSLNDRRLIYVSKPISEQKISAIEYSVDTIMSFGGGNIINITPADSLNYTFTFNHGITDTFFHVLYTRVKDMSGSWSLHDSVIFKLENCIIPNADFTIHDICFGDSIILQNTSSLTDTGTVYNWDVYNDGQIESHDSIGYTGHFSNPGNYKVKLQVTNFVCIDTAIKSIQVFPKPEALVSLFGSNTFCPDGFTVLSANLGLGYQYQWFRNGTLINNANSSYLQTSDSGDYQVAINNIYNCKDTSEINSLSLYDLPAASINPSGNTTFCTGDSIYLQANISAGLSYEWYKNGTIINGANQSSLNVKTQGDYKVKITNNSGCSDISAVESIVVNPKPISNITAGGALQFCQGNQVNLYATAGLGYSYQWFNDSIPITGATSSYIIANQSGDYSVKVSNAFQCSDTSSTTAVTVNPAPTSTITFAGSTSICQGDTLLLRGNSGIGYSYQWKSYGSIIPNAFDSVFRVLQTGNYSLVVTNANNCSTESAPQLINVNAVPGASILPLSSTSFCGGDSVILSANAGSGLSYQWMKNGNFLVDDTNAVYIAKSTAAYSVKVSNGLNCHSTSTPSNINVFPIPTSSFTIPSEVCSSDTTSIVYAGTASAGAFYNWNFGGATVISGTGQGPYQLRWNTAGDKTISLIVNENGCSSPLNSSQTLVKTVQANITAPITSVCQGDSVLLTANGGQAYNYQWFQGGVALAADTLSILNVGLSGFYQVKVIDANIGCNQMSQPIQVSIHPSNFNLAFSSSVTNFSQPPFDITINNTTPNLNQYSFQWELGDGSTSTFYHPMHSYQYNGDYTISLYAENSTTGCHDTLTKYNYIHCAGGAPNPCNIVAAITPAGPITLCKGDSIALTASTGTGYSYQWVFNNTLLASETTGTIQAKQSGSYRVIVSNAICSQTSPAFVLNHFPSIQPNIQATGSIQPCTVDSMKLSLLVNYTSYNWSNGKTSPSIYINQTGYYQVVVTDNYGCNMISTPYVVSNSLLNPPSICIVGVDSANHNRLVWERQHNALIDSFYIYREGFVLGQYDKIGEIPFSSTSLFVDNLSNPSIKAYKYKIAAVDTCGGITLLSDLHKTIHLTINAGLNGSWNLIWDGYQGFPFNTYRIYRGTNSSSMSLLTQLPSTATSYTDLNPPTGTVYYQIEVIKNTGCYPDTVYTKANTNYNTSRSNTANNASIVPIYLTADFNADVMSGIWPIQVNFTDQSTGSPNQWHWNFGDGNTSNLKHPQHTYNNTGLYSVSLVACNGLVCDTLLKPNYINVLPNGLVEVGIEMSAKIYPNPNDGEFTLEINDLSKHKLQLHIYNMIGAEVFYDEFESHGLTTKKLNLQTLPKGVYFVHLNTSEKVVYTGKVVIE